MGVTNNSRFFNFLEKLSLAGSDLVDCRYPRRDRKGDCGNVDDRAIKTIALNCPRLKYIDLYKGKLNLNYFSQMLDHIKYSELIILCNQNHNFLYMVKVHQGI